MKGALYLRVSTSEQTTLNQRLALETYCKNNKIDIVEIYNDEGVSGTKDTRPALDRMLNDMRQKKFDCIVVWKFDRLGRSTKHLLQVLEEMQKKDVRLIATSQNIDTATPMGKFFFVILSGFAEMEREMIVERIRLGLDRKKKQGYKLGRPKGSIDKKKRRTSGYHLMWDKKKNTKKYK